MTGETGDQVLACVRRVAATGIPDSVEYPLELGGRMHWFLARMAPIASADGTNRTVCSLTRDITLSKESEEGLRRLQAERTDLLRRTVDATEQERQRLAAELHDGAIQQLTALDLRLEAAGRHMSRSDPERALQLVLKAQTKLREQIGDLRRMMIELRPPILDERGLEAALEDHLRVVGETVSLSFAIDSELDTRLPPEIETILYRVAQEACRNIQKHAAAEHVRLSLRHRGTSVVMEIDDDGAGFDPQDAFLTPAGEHFGLIGMRERVEMAGGTWEVASTPGQGTQVRASVPVAESPDEVAERALSGFTR